MTAQEQTRRLITLRIAGRNRRLTLDVNLENQGPTALGADGKPRPLIQYQDLHNGHPCAGAFCDSR